MKKKLLKKFTRSKARARSFRIYANRNLINDMTSDKVSFKCRRDQSVNRVTMSLHSLGTHPRADVLTHAKDPSLQGSKMQFLWINWEKRKREKECVSV